MQCRNNKNYKNINSNPNNIKLKYNNKNYNNKKCLTAQNLINSN